MDEVEIVRAKDGRLSSRLAAMLEPELQDGLDHPVRREILRVLNRNGRAWSLTEIETELCSFRLSQLIYHLVVLQRSKVVGVPEVDGIGGHRIEARYVSEVTVDGAVLAVLRATERWDREWKRASVALTGSRIVD